MPTLTHIADTLSSPLAARIRAALADTPGARVTALAKRLHCDRATVDTALSLMEVRGEVVGSCTRYRRWALVDGHAACDATHPTGMKRAPR